MDYLPEVVDKNLEHENLSSNAGEASDLPIEKGSGDKVENDQRNKLEKKAASGRPMEKGSGDAVQNDQRKKPKKKAVSGRPVEKGNGDKVDSDQRKKAEKKAASGRTVEKGIGDRVVSDQPKKPEKKAAAHPPTSEMILASIKALKKKHGAPTDAIHKHIEENYEVDSKKIKPLVTRCLQQHVEKGVLVKVKGAGDTEKFKVAKTEGAKNAYGKASGGKVASQKVPAGLKNKTK